MPVWRITKFTVAEAEFPAVAEEKHLAVAQFQFKKRIVRVELVEPMAEATIDAAAFDRDVLDLVCNDEMATVCLLIDADAILHAEMRVVPCLLLAARQQHRAWLQEKPAMASQEQSACLVYAWR